MKHKSRLNILKILEYSWLAIGCISALISLYIFLLVDAHSKDLTIFSIFAVIAFLLYFIRHKQRKRFENGK